MLNVVEQLPGLNLILFFDYGEPYLLKDAIPFLQLEQLRNHGGIADGRYMARLSLDRDTLTGSSGSRIACLLTVGNLSPSEWRAEEGPQYNIGVRLRLRTGPALRELHRMPVPAAVSPPGGKETVLLEVLLPDPQASTSS